MQQCVEENSREYQKQIRKKVGDLWLFLAAALANLNTFSRTEFSLTVYEYDLTRYKLRSLGMRIQRHYRAALSSEDFQ